MSRFLDKQTGFLFLFASLTLGLAPFVPEPHIWANLRWIAGGAVGMGAENWGDTLMHGAPWVLLLSWVGVKGFVFLKGRRKVREQDGIGAAKSETSARGEVAK